MNFGYTHQGRYEACESIPRPRVYINQYLLQYVLEVTLSYMVTRGVNNGLAYDWRNIAKKILQKDEG